MYLQYLHIFAIDHTSLSWEILDGTVHSQAHSFITGLIHAFTQRRRSTKVSLEPSKPYILLRCQKIVERF